MLYAGLDLSRQRLDVHVLDEAGRTVEVLAVHPDADALRTLANRVLRHGQEVSAAIESMTGSRFVHDTLERFGWDVMIADAVKAKGVAPLAAKTDKIDAHVLAELARRDLVPEIWLPTPSGPPPERVEVPHSCHAHYLRSHCSGHRPVRDIPQPSYEIGRMSVSLLLDRISQPSEERRTLRLEPKFLHRESCGCGSEAIDARASVFDEYPLQGV